MAFSLPVIFLLFAALLTVVYVSAVFHGKGWVVRFLFPGRPVQTVSWDWWDALLIGALFFLLPGIVLFLFEALPVSASGFFTISEEEFQRALLFDGGGESGTNGGIDGSEGTPVGGDPPALLELDGKERSIRDNLSKEHPLTILMTIASRVPRFFWVPLICFLTGVITAPITEEFIFRVLLQGAAEKIFRVPWGAIAFSALLFAVIHYRTPFALNSADRLNVILKSIAIVPLAHLLILLLGVLWLRRVVGATWSELGFCRRGMLRDFGRGVVAFFFLAPIIFLTQSALGALFPDLVTDPAAILILAIGLGILYRQTGSLSAVVGTHSALNFVSFCGVLMAIRSGGL